MKQKFSVSLTLALIAAMLVTSLALADQVGVDNDIVSPGNQSSVNLTVSPDATVTTSAQLVVDYQGSRHLTAGSQLVLQVGTHDLPAGYNVSEVTTTVPNPWGSGDQFVAGTSNISFTAPNTPGTYVYTLKWDDKTKTCSSGGDCVGSGNAFTINLTVSAPPPPSDTTPPVITPTVSGTLGNNGWYVSDVTVSWSVSDAESAISSSSGCGSTTISSDTSGQTLTCSATSAGGTSEQSVTIKRDATAPTISGSASPAPNGAGWNKTDVSVSFLCSDALSGIASCGPNQILNTDGAGQSESGTAVDNAGNSASTTVSGINIDKTAPTASASASPTPNGNSWNNSNVTVSFSGSDALSGIASCSVPVVLSSEGAGQFATGTCTDLAGNVSAPATASGINIDKTAPITSASALPVANANGWNNTDVTVSFTGDDGVGSGIDFCDAAVVLSSEGAGQSASGTCTDKAGNVSAAMASGINIDKTAPAVAASVSPAPNDEGWNNTNVTVSFSGTDLLSDIAMCDADVVLNSEGAGQFATGSCIDNAGNSASATADNINIDKTPPTVSWSGGPEEGASYYFGFVPLPPEPNEISVSDNLSGPNWVSVAGYSPEVGEHQMTITASDLAGNITVKTRTYKVLAWTLNGFYKPVDMSGLIPVWNTVKGGSTVPLKFEVFAGLMELTDTSYISGFSATPVSCGLGLADAIEVTATGGTSLRYDSVAGQFIYNWQTPKSPGSCYKITMSTLDGSSLSALFKLK